MAAKSGEKRSSLQLQPKQRSPAHTPRSHPQLIPHLVPKRPHRRERHAQHPPTRERMVWQTGEGSEPRSIALDSFAQQATDQVGEGDAVPEQLWLQ